jgi:hypothetical protein
VDGEFKVQTWTSRNLPVGQRDKVTLPADAKNVSLSAYMISAGERHVKSVSNPDFNKEYKVYGTIFSPQLTEQ